MSDSTGAESAILEARVKELEREIRISRFLAGLPWPILVWFAGAHDVVGALEALERDIRSVRETAKVDSEEALRRVFRDCPSRLHDLARALFLWQFRSTFKRFAFVTLVSASIGIMTIVLLYRQNTILSEQTQIQRNQAITMEFQGRLLERQISLAEQAAQEARNAANEAAANELLRNFRGDPVVDARAIKTLASHVALLDPHTRAAWLANLRSTFIKTNMSRMEANNPAISAADGRWAAVYVSRSRSDLQLMLLMIELAGLGHDVRPPFGGRLVYEFHDLNLLADDFSGLDLGGVVLVRCKVPSPIPGATRQPSIRTE